VITLAMLVLDPPLDRLSALLDVLRPVIGQAVVVMDDRTDPETYKALRGMAEVVPFTWCDDFAAARNAALPFVQGDWVLMLDPDETPSPEMVAFLGFVDRSPWLDVNWVDRVHWAPRGYLFWRSGEGLPDTQECEWHTRLFRTGSARWTRPIHEIVEFDGVLEFNLRETARLPKAPRSCSFEHNPTQTPEKAEMYERIVGKARAAGWDL
jgi:glycosyltransferase involved in cell wall biosynthesis